MARAQVVITMEDDGSVTVAGPLSEPVLLYGLLGAAHDVVQQYQEASKMTVKLADGPLPPSRH